MMMWRPFTTAFSRNARRWRQRRHGVGRHCTPKSQAAQSRQAWAELWPASPMKVHHRDGRVNSHGGTA
jgi:hypothetical protein